MTHEELFDAYRQVVSQRDQLAAAGDLLWSDLGDDKRPRAVLHSNLWAAVRKMDAEPPVEDWAEC